MHPEYLKVGYLKEKSYKGNFTADHLILNFLRITQPRPRPPSSAKILPFLRVWRLQRNGGIAREETYHRNPDDENDDFVCSLVTRGGFPDDDKRFKACRGEKCEVSRDFA